MTLSELNKKFVYKTDKEQFGFNEVWTGLIPVDNKLIGDCEDYAITLKKEVKEFKDWDYFYCKLFNDGHCILVNKEQTLMIDNNLKRVVSLYDFEKIYEVTELRKYSWFELMFKFTQAKIILFWLKLNGKL